MDTSSFQIGVAPGEDPAVEQPLLDELASDARAFVASHPWAPPIDELLLAFGIGGIMGLFLVRFVSGITSGEGQGDREIWVVVGELPSIYFETEAVETRVEAVEAYCNIAEDWADHILAGESLSESFPIDAEPTREHAEMLKSRIRTIREDFIPMLD